MPAPDYGPPRGDDELQAYRRILQQSFDMELERSATWLERAGASNVRLLRVGGRVAAGLLLVEMGQYFGATRVPMTGVAAVGSAPEARGGGAATRMMRAAIEELRALGRPLSALYPATLPLYRRAGYELAGTRMRVTADTRSLPAKSRALSVRPIEASDAERVEALYEAQARTRPGYLARGDYAWNRVRSTREGSADGYLVERDGEAVGYLYLVRTKRAPIGYDLALTDLVARDAEAAERLFTLVADHRSLAKEVHWMEGPSSPLLTLLPERGHRVEVEFTWMLRVVDARAALEARGYAPCVAGELELALVDELCAENSGAFVLRVEGGRASLAPGGRGELALDVRGLAALYSGYQSAEGLAQCGLARGAPEVLRRASGFFAGAAPGMVDMF